MLGNIATRPQATACRHDQGGHAGGGLCQGILGHGDLIGRKQARHNVAEILHSTAQNLGIDGMGRISGPETFATLRKTPYIVGWMLKD